MRSGGEVAHGSGGQLRVGRGDSGLSVSEGELVIPDCIPPARLVPGVGVCVLGDFP